MTPLFLAILAAPPELFPADLLYPSYLGGPKESRISDIKLWEPDRGWLWDITLGGRAGALRLDVSDVLLQLDMEAAAFVRLDLDTRRDLLTSEFKYGLWVTMRLGGFSTKLGYYHLSAHLGDEASERAPNGYSRDAFSFGMSYDVALGLRVYGEIEHAFVVAGPAKNVHIQLGASWAPVAAPFRGGPYAAFHASMRQENDFALTATLQAGWQWLPRRLGRSYRLGLWYLGGPSPYYQFLEELEHQVGVGNWFEF